MMSPYQRSPTCSYLLQEFCAIWIILAKRERLATHVAKHPISEELATGGNTPIWVAR